MIADFAIHQPDREDGGIPNLGNMLSILTEDDLAELKTLLEELPPLEQRFLIGLLENLTLEEVWNFLDDISAC